MWARTIGMLSNLRDMKPRVVLKKEPTNPNDHLAVMARAMGNKIGYVCKEHRNKVRTIMSQTKRGMLAADISKVVVDKHGYLFITLKCEEAVDDSAQEPGFDWSEWQTDIPLLPPMEALHAEEEAEFILEEELLPQLTDVNITELQTYLGIWMEGSRHDMSHEACRQRELYIKLLEESTRDEVRELAGELKHQSGSMCSLHRLEERTLEWWPRLVNSAEAANMWGRWCEQTNNQLWGGLRLIDDLLHQLPGNLYQNIGHMEAIFSQLYYLCIPRDLIETGDLNRSALQFILHLHTRSEYDAASSDEVGLHILEVFHCLRTDAEAHGSQTGQRYGVSLGGPRAEYFTCGIPSRLDHTSRDTAVGTGLCKHFLLLDGNVKIRSHHELLHPRGLADFQQSALRNYFNSHNLKQFLSSLLIFLLILSVSSEIVLF